MTNTKKKLLALCVAVPLAVGGLAALLTRGGMRDFQMLNQPPLTPPPWAFAVVWTILYALMGAASYLVLTSRRNRRAVRTALTVYGVQLAANFLWTIIFFNLKWYFFAFLWLLCLWALIALTLSSFYRIRRPAGILLIPYLLWATFAAYLNLGVWRLN